MGGQLPREEGGPTSQGDNIVFKLCHGFGNKPPGIAKEILARLGKGYGGVGRGDHVSMTMPKSIVYRIYDAVLPL